MRVRVAKETREDILREAFNSFAEISTSVEKVYGDLREKVRRLSFELEESNKYLHTMLQSLPCGVVVESSGVVTSLNQRALELLGLGNLTAPVAIEQMLDRIPEDSARELFLSEDPPIEVSLGKPSRFLSCAWSAILDGERVLVIQDVSELRYLQEKMRKTERRAAMGEMALEVAHEIRNPLTGLALYASLLREEDLTPQDQRRYLDNIDIGIRSLETTLTNMLSLSRNPDPKREKVILKDLLTEILGFMSPLISERGIKVRSGFEPASLLADPELLRQVFMNLILNALQALPSDGTLSLRTFSENGSAVAEIRDDGVGIPEGLQETIFEPRFTTTNKGSGLGLGIVKKIVEAHRGRVGVESRKGWGTRFTLTFPSQQRST